MAAEGYQPPYNKVSLRTAKAIPIFLALVVAYASYVVVGPLSINYLINAPENVPPRVPAGIAIPIVWFFLLVPVTVTYARLLICVSRDPGYTPLGHDEIAGDPPPEYWMRDVFVCDEKGLPIYCKHCRNWKPDRAHHNQDTGRCTLRMDHFCPWVGGVVGERSLKFFIQFLFYSCVLSTYLMILLAYFVHKNRSNVHWLVALGIAGFFVLFTLGMVINTLHHVLLSTTTIENIDHTTRTMLLAVLLPPEMQPGIEQPARGYTPPSRSAGSDGAYTSEINDPSHESYFSRLDVHRPIRRLSKSEYWRGTMTYPLNHSPRTDRPPLPAPAPRTFAILETPPGMNPWYISPGANFKAVFGNKVHQWFLPTKHSPVCDHSSSISFYPLGPQFEDLLEDAGLVQRPLSNETAGWESSVGGSRTTRSKRKKRRLPEGWQNGERPDGWVSEKEARRRRSDARRREMEDSRREFIR